MAYIVEKHPIHDNHYFVNGVLVAGAKDTQDAICIFEESRNSTD